ncbi:MAG: SMI1/KNR4 family protein [Clostridia bacterium]|nr:SMI1/KNR4 family protein [Clostridia bacterium]
MNFYDSGDILTGDMIAQFENDLNLSLPSDYKSFMLKVNGGTPEDDWMFSFVDSANGELNNSDCAPSQGRIV